MYLKNLKLWNFRKFGGEQELNLSVPDLDLNFTKGVNVLIGENDSGKSAIVDAIKLVLKTHSYEWFRVNDDDFYSDQERFRIEILFDDLLISESKNFTEWLGWTGDGENAKPYLRLIYDVRRNIEGKYIYPTDVKAGVDDTGYQLTAEAKSYLKTTYLKPLRDAKSELVPKRNSRLTQILQAHDAFKGSEEHILVDLFKKFNTSVQNYFLGLDNKEKPLTGNDLKGQELKNEIDKFIKAFYEKSKESKFGVQGNNLKNILEKLELTIKDDINPGLGTLNRLFMASELLHLQKKNWTGLRLGLIEEMEAHLHPQAQMQIIEALQQEKDIQLILTTHSPNLGSKLKLENLILCADSYAYPLGNTYTQLAAEDYTFLERFLDATKANLFFAKGVILVEGWSEELLLPAIAKNLKKQNIISKDLTEAGVSIVNIAGTAFRRYSRVYLRKDEDPKKLHLPVAIVTDVDIRNYYIEKNKDAEGKVINSYVKRDDTIVKKESIEKSEKIKDEFDCQYVKTFIASNWTLEYAIYKSTCLNKKFEEVLIAVHSKIDKDNIEQELAKKLINKTLNKTDIAYRLSEMIENPSIIIDENDPSIKYLIDAIKYTCND